MPIRLHDSVVTDWEGSTRNAERIARLGVSTQDILGGDLQGTLPNPTLAGTTNQRFLQMAAAGAHFVNFGTGTANFAGTTAGIVVASHGLSSTPGAVFVTGTDQNAIVTWRTYTYTGTQFTARGDSSSGVIAAGSSFVWVALV